MYKIDKTIDFLFKFGMAFTIEDLREAQRSGKASDLFLDPKTKQFRKGNPGRPKGIVNVRSPSNLKKIAKLIMEEIFSSNDGVAKALQYIWSEQLKCFNPVEFKEWLKDKSNRTIFYKILLEKLPAQVAVDLNAESRVSVTYELLLPQILEAKKKGLLTEPTIRFNIADNIAERQVVESQLEE